VVIVENDGYQFVVAAGGAGNEAGAGFAGCAGFYAVRFFEHPEEFIGVAQVDVFFAPAAVEPFDADFLAADNGGEGRVGEGEAGEEREVVGGRVVAGGR
jgi:hypothetical protein